MLKHRVMHAETMCDASDHEGHAKHFLLAHMCWFQHRAESSSTGPSQGAQNFLSHYHEVLLSGATLPCSVRLRHEFPCGEAGHCVQMPIAAHRGMKSKSADDHSITTFHHAHIALGTFSHWLRRASRPVAKMTSTQPSGTLNS
mgnify:CR=1 FL=1